jgi:Glycosyl hydrolase family 57/Secretion system C-terminal sorting domain
MYLKKILPLSILLMGVSLFAQKPPIHIAFLWHMHQPVYWPYENVTQTISQNRYSFSLSDVFNTRTGPYTSWPKDAVQKGISAGLGNFGAQVSFSGSLVENLNNLESAGWSGFQNWKSHWNTAKNNLTTLGNPRIDMVGFGYHHPLMGLIDDESIRRQIQQHKQIFQTSFPGAYSKGIFPPENAFASTMIPSLVNEGIQWALIDNIHFDRACASYPFNTSGNVYEPNKADQINQNPSDWVQLNGLWAPTRNSAAWGRKPHFVEYVDPATGVKSRIVAVPCDRYMGNEDGRGGFGALNYESVMSQIESYNNDPLHPIIIVLHHDGDNYGGGTDSYYQGNFQNFVNWLVANPTRFKCTTVQDYLDQFPPNANDVIHVENGSWSGADNGDPEFKKWNADYSNCLSHDRNSWGTVVAATNWAQTSGNDNAWKYLTNAQASDYWYWDGSNNGIWDAHPTRACNLAIQACGSVPNTEGVPPTIWIPQREPYNPGASEWNQNQSSDFTVFSYVYDVSGLQNVTLKYRLDSDGTNPLSNTDNETYSGGSSVGAWQNVTMSGAQIISLTSPQPLYKAKEYSGQIKGLSNQLVDYYVEATDTKGNIAKSPIQHVWVGASNALTHTWENCDGRGDGTGTVITPTCTGTRTVTWTPLNPTSNDIINIKIKPSSQSGTLHWGVNTWKQVNTTYRPSGSSLWSDNIATRSAFGTSDANCAINMQIGPFNNPSQMVSKVDFVVNFADNSWDNNGGGDYHINITQALPIELLDFKATKKGSKALLLWQTASEINSFGFDVEKSSDGENFSKIGFLKANNTPSVYRFVDDNLIQTSYYRLNQVDIDGKSEYSKIVSLSENKSKVLAKVYPNPFSQYIAIDLSKTVSLELLDVVGRLIYSEKNVSERAIIQTDVLAKGVYFLKISDGIETMTEKMIKN